MGPTGEQNRIVQVHPTRRCNLRCLHCYSSSAPEERDALPVTLLAGVLTDAAREGYTVAAFSGGEPLLYEPLPQLLEHAHRCGLATTVSSNGMLLTTERLASLEGRADLLAISLDGTPDSHNRMRAHDRAFEIMQSRLERVRQSGIPFGFIFTLTQHNLHELEWVANFALEEGAKLLQIHPLEEAGRAGVVLPGMRPDAIECTFAYLEARRMQQRAGDRMAVHVDLVHRGLLRENPDRVFADRPREDSGRRLADLVSPLVIEADGTVVPLGYGFARPYALGNLNDGSLRDLAETWRTRSYAGFRKLCSTVFEENTGACEMPFFNWYEVIGRRSLETEAFGAAAMRAAV